MSRKLEGKVAVVTGASKGIGASIAKALADEGASVVVNYSSSKPGADRVVAEITGRGGKAIAVQGDVSEQAHIERLFSEATKAFGRLDILVNNGGLSGVVRFEVHDGGDAASGGRAEIEFSSGRCAREVLRHLAQSLARHRSLGRRAAARGS